jgi:hypothetical protein
LTIPANAIVVSRNAGAQVTIADQDCGGSGIGRTDLALVRGRTCGTCRLCCKVYSIAELSKPAGQWCPHLTRTAGCTVYRSRPHDCRQFFCAWRLDPNLGPEWKPEVSRFVLSADPRYQALTVTVDPGAPLAWKKEPYYSRLKSFSAGFFTENKRVLVNVRSHTIVILPDRDVPLGVIVPGEEIVIWREGATYQAVLRRHMELAKATEPGRR